MKEIKIKAATAVLAVCILVISLFANFHYIRKASLYEEYLSKDKVTNALGNLSSGIKELEKSMEEAVNKKSLTKEELNTIVAYGESFAFNVEELDRLANNLKIRVNRPEAAGRYHHFDIVQYIKEYKGRFRDKDFYELNTVEVREFEIYLDTIRQYAEIFKNRSFGIGTISIRDNLWIKTLELIHNVNKGKFML